MFDWYKSLEKYDDIASILLKSDAMDALVLDDDGCIEMVDDFGGVVRLKYILALSIDRVSCPGEYHAFSFPSSNDRSFVVFRIEVVDGECCFYTIDDLIDCEYIRQIFIDHFRYFWK